MNKIIRCGLVIVLSMLSMGVYSQTMPSSHWSTTDLLERAKHLRELASNSDGSASERLEKYPHHYTMLAFRQRSGGGELHQNFADIFYILDGHASLVTGGKLVEHNPAGPGEFRAKAVEGGSRQELKSGDVVHIPAGMPHQMLLGNGDTVTYFVVKVEENR